MSKTPVRSALERLESEGFISISPQQGAIIRDLSLGEVADQYEIRVALETFVARGLAGRLTPDPVARLESNLEAQRANLDAGDIDRSIALDEEFHSLLRTSVGNREILRVMVQLRDKTHRVIYRAFKRNPGRIAPSYEEHRAIAEATVAGDVSLAARQVEQHRRFGKGALLSPRRYRRSGPARRCVRVWPRTVLVRDASPTVRIAPASSKRDYNASEDTTSPPSLVPMALQVSLLIESLMNLTLPSQNSTLTPPGCQLRAATNTAQSEAPFELRHGGCDWKG
jgi:DNA-binding GntR family transcriptional regulator